MAEEAVSCEPVSANGFPWYQGKLQGNFRIPRSATNFVAKSRLRRVLADWCPPYSGYHLYYPSRRQPSATFNLVVDTLRHRG